MQFGDLGGVLGEDEDEVYGVRAGDGVFFDVFDGAGLFDVFGGTLEYRFQPWSVLELFVSVGVLVRLQGGDRVVCS